jgi:uncharacterized protein YcaQ
LASTVTTAPIRLSQDEARRFLVTRHGLATPRSLPAERESVLSVVDRAGMLQFDPLEVPGARNHDLVLHSRIDGYRREWTDEWLYGADRRLFEIYNKSLNIIPIDELPHHRVSWDRHAEHYNDGILREHAEVAHNILQRISAEGPLSTAAFAEHGHSIDWWWAPTRIARAVLEALFVVGRVGISRRDGNRRYYDLVERLVPEELLHRRESAEDGHLHRMLSRYRAVGLTWPSAPPELMMGTGKVDERARRTSMLAERGDLVPVEVEGLKGTRYAPATDRQLIGDAQATGQASGEPGVAFIAPLDPLMWDRRLLRQLWAFDYVWEVYVPEQKRRWGYYVLPILFGEQLVGRFEPRVDRAKRTLRILGIWWQDGFSPRTAEGFVPAMRDALRAYMQFVGASRIEWLPPTAAAGRPFGTLRTSERK